MSDRYKVYEQLGAGGVGAVFRAYDSQLKRWVAIKRLSINQEAIDSGSDLRDELRQEADSLASLRNPNIVTIFDVAEDADGLFIVMELLEGEDLADVVARGPLPYDDFKELAYQSLEGLLAAHQHQILHRDIKPENIKVERLPGGRMQAKIIDFGLARIGLKARKQTEDITGSVMGSIFYMAPEQLTREPVDERTDIYSLGCIFYEALSGQKAFDGATIAEVIDNHINHVVTPLHTIAPHVPPWLGAWVERLMAPRPEDRPANAQQAMEEFRAWERMPSMVPYMPWMAMPMMPDPNANMAYAQAVVDDDEAVAVAFVDDDTPAARAVSAPVQAHRQSPSHSSAHRLPKEGSGAHPTKSGSKSRLPIIIGGVVLLVAAAAFFLMGKGSQDKSAKGGAGGKSAKSPAAASVKFDLPTDRMMPPLDEDRCLHFVADVGTLKGGRSSDGKPFPAYTNDSVIEWRDVAPRGSDNPLQPWQGKEAFSPKRILWPVAPSSASVKGNRAALDFKATPAAPRALEGDFSSASKAFPFGGEINKGAKGVTIAVVFQNSADARDSTLATFLGEGKDTLVLKLTADKKLLVQAISAAGQAHVTSENIDVSKPTIAVVTWESSNGKVNLLALNPPDEAKGKLVLFQGSSTNSAATPSAPLTRLRIGSGDNDPARQFHGILGELLIYTSALNAEQSRMLGSTQLKAYYFKL